MRNKGKNLWPVTIGAALLLGTGCSQMESGAAKVEPPGQEKDYGWFLNQLIDLDRLTQVEEGVQCKQFSSYDRASKYDEATGKYLNWDANGDCGKYIRVDPQTGEGVMAEMDGPGCIWRIWSANPQGVIRIYLDGAQKPTFEHDFNKLFRKGESPFPGALIWQRRVNVGGGNPASDCYMPIPFAKSCKVTADKPQNQYYHIGYATYPRDWKIKSFSLQRTQAEEATLQRVCQALSNCGQDPHSAAGLKVIEKTVNLAPGQRAMLADLPGPATIRQFYAKLKSDEPWARRKVLLQMHWDGQAAPAVDAPIGDFFGDAWDEAEYKSLPLGITSDMNYCYWRMPFARMGRIVVVNQCKKPAELRCKIAYGPGKLPADCGYFHAKWRRERNSDNFDYPLLETVGRGKFVGVVLFPHNILGGWWGEGDEKVYVDGEKFPSTFGTGSEDYFGDAWGIRYFVNPFHGCPTRKEEAICQSCYRWHIADNIPYGKTFKITIENYAAHRQESTRNDYSSMAYWYQVPGGKDFFAPTTVQERIPQGKIVMGVVEAETTVAADNLPSGASIVCDEDMSALLSRSKGLKISGTAGTTVTIKLPVPDDGQFTIEAGLAEKAKASSFEILKEGRPVGERVRLKKGDNTVEIRLTGQPVEGQRCAAVFDYFRLHPYRNLVRDWYIIGPFANTEKEPGFDRAYGPETEPFNAQATYDGKGGKKVGWQKINVPTGLVVEDSKYFENDDHIAIYGYCMVVSPDDRKATVYVGSDDGIKVFVNGRQVHAKNVVRGLQLDQDRFEVDLKKGTNAILVKCLENTVVWSFALRVNDPNEELRYTLPPQ